MNGQIEELITKTDAWCDQNLPHNWTDRVDEYLPVWNSKFAELIVRECANVCSGEFASAIGSHAAAHNSAVVKCVDGIYKHFGVE